MATFTIIASSKMNNAHNAFLEKVENSGTYVNWVTRYGLEVKEFHWQEDALTEYRAIIEHQINCNEW